MNEETRLRLKLMAGLLDYPGTPGFWTRLAKRREDLRDLLPRLSPVIQTWETLGRDRLARIYVETFDFGPKTALYLTVHEMGDSRNRGAALLELTTLYRREGFEPPDEELPDFIPSLLELAAVASDETGMALYERLGQVAAQLSEALSPDHPYRPIFDALKDTLTYLAPVIPPSREETPDIDHLPYPVEYR